jgi:hypothetical protein
MAAREHGLDSKPVGEVQDVQRAAYAEQGSLV